jgi:putative transposase
MNSPKREAIDYIDFLAATPKVCSALEAARVQPDPSDSPAHDAFTRLLHRLEPNPETLWQEAAPQVRKTEGFLVLDDSTLDKPYSCKIELVTRHWSGKHHAVVKGINLLTTLWTDGDRHLPCDYRLYDKSRDGLTKNDLFLAMLKVAHSRGFQPQCVAFDGWYSSLENLKAIRGYGWIWLTRLKSNRGVNLDRQGVRPVAVVTLSATGTEVYLPGFGLVRVFRIVAPDGSTTHWATNDLTMTALTRLQIAEASWKIEEYHRGIKQFCGVERAQVRSARAQRNHIGLSLRAFLRLEYHCYTTGVSWFEAKTAIIRQAVRTYLAQPWYKMPSTA